MKNPNTLKAFIKYQLQPSKTLSGEKKNYIPEVMQGFIIRGECWSGQMNVFHRTTPMPWCPKKKKTSLLQDLLMEGNNPGHFLQC